MREKGKPGTEVPVQRFLEQYLIAEEEIQSQKDHIASLRSIVENTITHLSFTAGCTPSKDAHKFENSMIDIVEEERKFAQKMRELALIQASVENLISLVQDPKQKRLLRYKYVEGMKMSEIAEELDISRPGAYLLFEKALKAAEHIFRN
jgi:DNA-directed RNA polymerase specialized sigma24 family protein